MVKVNKSDVVITAGDVFLEGMLAVPGDVCGIVAFAHGSGSSRFSRRNQGVARQLNEAGLATLLFDLLSADENARDAVTAEYRFDIPLLAERLAQAVDWLARDPATRTFPVGLFGASTGAAAALIAAAERPARVRAVVSRGGRPDLAGEALGRVRAATLLIVGGADIPVIGLNEQAAARLSCPHQLVIVPGATHLFEEPGALEQVSKLASDWFRRHFASQLHLAKAAGHG
ncbi:MAG: dienelactone hydrolase family protein [Bacillota bacterium]